MISILIETVYGGGASAAAAKCVSSAKGMAAPEAIIWRRLIRGFIGFIFALSGSDGWNLTAWLL
jgi:hypothetical protein